MRRATPAVVASLLAIGAASARAADPLPEWGKGPFEVSDPYALAELRATHAARSPRVPGHLELELGARAVWESSYGWLDDASHVHRGTIDAETRTLDLVARLGLLGRVELGLELRALHWRGGGVLDRVIREFHRDTGISSLDRERRPNDSYLVSGSEPAGSSFALAGRGTFLGDSRVTARALALEGSELLPAVTLGATLWLPTASPGLGHADGTATTLSVDLSKRLLDLPLVAYAGAAYTYHDVAAVQGLHLTRHRGLGWVGFEWEIVPRLSVVAHFWGETRRERKLYRGVELRYGNFVQYVAFGLKLEPIDGLTLELGVLEDLLDPNTTGDFGFLVNAWYRFAPAGAPPPAGARAPE